MKKINYIAIIILVSCLFTCKNNKTDREKEAKIQKIDEYIDIEIKDTSQVLSLDFLQGYWQGESDVNMNTPYRVIDKNNVLDIICIEGVCEINTKEYTHVEVGLIGFTNDTLQDFSNVDNLEKTGRYLVLYNKESEKVRFDENIEYDSNSYTTSLTSDFMLYTKSPSAFVKLDSIPKVLQAKYDSIIRTKKYFKR
ncbi:hypothetical protein [Sinomicrobium oceani]|uniref:hypothetical protein n=1 Tax=Sinomicrobium oceani TaxID=1150368 RepID=UPI00227B2AB2|nr:hypothetical protein [Sinomicrobium oceani]